MWNRTSFSLSLALAETMTYEAPIGHVNDHDFYPTYIFDIDISVVFLPSLLLMIYVYRVVSTRRSSLPSRASTNTHTEK